MVVLNDVFPINYNKMKKLLSHRLNEKLLNILDEIFYKDNDKEIYIEYILKNMKEELKEIMDNNHFLDLSINYNYCNHLYKSGKNNGYLCGAKIFINPDNGKKPLFKCSRHCRNYSPKPRNYSIENPRCDYIRKTGEQCKHRCSKYNTKCYIHNNSKDDKKIINLKINKINKLRHLKLLYYKKKTKKKDYNFKKSKLNKNKKEYHIYEKIYKIINKYMIKDKKIKIKKELNKIHFNVP